MGSSRFPGKPLAKIKGRPMVGFIYQNVCNSKIITDTYIATCDPEIRDYLKKIKANFVMTSKKHTRATERCAEALIKIEKEKKIKYDIVVMLQGDEPLITRKMIEKGVVPLLTNKRNFNVTNLTVKIRDKRELNDNNCIKVIFDKNYNAIYFSRSPLFSNYKKFFGYKQVCSIAFDRKYLLSYLTKKETFLEKAQSIDMLRIIENGEKIKMVKVSGIIQSVDTKNDLNKVNKILN